ncbi:hypothetical protein GQR58_024144 [Nymphon striatum]|nr:hypothetical protein GQR58_024144 [Nymphon striatum]
MAAVQSFNLQITFFWLLLDPIIPAAEGSNPFLSVKSQSLTVILLDILLLVRLDEVFRVLRRSLLTWDLTHQGLFGAIVVSLFFAIVFFVTCILMIYGVATRKRKFMYPWLAFLIVAITVTLILGLFVLGHLYSDLGDLMWAGVVGIILINLFHVIAAAFPLVAVVAAAAAAGRIAVVTPRNDPWTPTYWLGSAQSIATCVQVASNQMRTHMEL